MAAPADDLIPVKRPHFERRDGHLFFLASARPHTRLDAADEHLWEMIDGAATVGALRTSIADAAVRLQRLWDLGVCELVPPRFPEHRRPLLVIEPHMDDAILSVGGSMWARRESCEITLVTMAGLSNYTSYYDLDRDYFNVARVSALRRAESALATRMLGGRHETLDLLEAPLRLHPGDWSLDWYRRHRKLVDAFIMHASPRREVDAWAAAIEPVLESTDAKEIWLPLGVGGHTDHELARDACLLALSRRRGIEQRADIYLYQDVPYATQFPLHTPALVGALTAAGAVLEPMVEDITATIDDKLRLASVFGSQFKPSYIAPRIEEAARRAGPSASRLGELRFRLRQLPGPVPALALYSRRAAVEAVAKDLTSWYDRHRSSRRIRVLTPVPVARWGDDLSALLDALPQATFEVHVSEEYADETESLTSPRLDVRIVRGRQTAWIARLARLVLSRPAPTILLTGEDLTKWAWLAKLAFVASDPLAATRLNDVVLALSSTRS